MALSLRIMLIICAILILVFVISKIKKTQMQALDSIFWLFSVSALWYSVYSPNCQLQFLISLASFRLQTSSSFT